jgi:hypothetical protein
MAALLDLLAFGPVMEAEPLFSQPLYTETIRVTRGRSFVGDILVAEEYRVLRADSAVPKDVVLKALVQFTRAPELSGELRGRDGRAYGWMVVDPVEV